MFSDLIKREVSKLVLVTFLYSNLSPAFCLQGVPEYVINVERKQTELGQMALMVTAQQLVQNTLLTGAVMYKTLIDQVIYPFMQVTTAMTATAKLYEVLQDIQATISANPNSSKQVKTQLSRGFCLSVPELGDLLISHEGDVVFTGNSPINKSVKITAPRQVVLDGINAHEMELEATAAFVTSHHSGKIDSLHFKANLGNDDDTIDNALVIENEAELEIGELTLEDALLMNAGRLSVKRSLDLQGGMFLNAGTFEITTKTATLKDIAYFHNAQNANFNATGQVILHTGNFSNNGNITAQDLNLISSELVNNTGTINTSSKLEINGVDGILNTGTINGASGNVSVYGTRFEQKGDLLASEVNLFANESVLAKNTKGQIAHFEGTTNNNGVLDFQKGTISGQFINSSKNAKFEQLLELTGDEAIIQSEGVIQTREIVANSKDAVIYSKAGEINVEKIAVKKNLQVEANLPTLKSITTDENSKFLLTKKSKTPELRKIENKGESTFLLGATELESLQNNSSGQLYLESSENLNRLRNLNSLNGKVALKGIFSAVDNLSVSYNTQLALLSGTRFTKARDFYIDRRAVVDLHNDAFSNLDGITNDGNMILRGGATQAGLSLRNTYKANRGAVLQMEEGSKISARDFNNWGTIQSRYSLNVTQHGDVTRWGDIKSEGDIDYSVDGTSFELNNSLIRPLARGRLKMEIDRDISISDSFETASDLEIKAQNLNLSGKLKAKKLKLRLKDFMLTGYVGSQSDIEVDCDNFTNVSGTLEALGNATFNVTSKFTNTGGKRTEQHTIEFPYYTCNTANSGPNNSEVRSGCKTLFGSLGRASDARLINHIGKTNINIYSLNPDTIANISAAGVLCIKADEIQNDFDIFYGRNGISLEGQRKITNIGGVIYTQNEIKIRSESLCNGLTEINDVFIYEAVDPSQPIRESYVRLREIEGLKHQRFEKEHDTYVIGYRRLPNNGKIHIQDTNAPGYIFSEGNVFIDAKMNTELGTVVSAKNIYIEGKNQHTTTKLIAHGNIAMSMVNINLAALKAKAETIAIQQRNNLILAGIIEPVAITDKNRSVMINLNKLAKSFGFALYDTPVLKSENTSLLTVSPSVRYGDNFVTVREPRKVGFKFHEDDANPFIPTLADAIIAKLIRLIVTPISGTPYCNIDLVGILEHNGLEYQSFILSNINDMPKNALALVYGNEEEREVLRDGTIVKIPQRSPYLVIGDIDEGTNYLKAKLEVLLKSQENIELHPQTFNIDTQNLTIDADKSMQLFPGLLNVPGNLTLSAKGDITNKGAQIEVGRDISITSKEGSIREKSISLDPKTKRVSSNSTVTQQDVITPATKAGGSIGMFAPAGTISQEGTHMKAGKAIQFDAKKHIVKPAYTTTEVNSKSGRTTSRITMTTPVAPVVEAPEIIFDSKDTTLVGAQIIATNRVENHSKLYATAAKGTKDSYAKTVKYRRCFGIRIGKSTQKVEDHETFYEPTRITGDYFENTGDGSVTLEGAVVDIAKEMNINGKDLIDKTFYTHKNTKVTRHSSGFFAPKIKGDPFIESTKALRHVSFGDFAPSALNVVGAGAQTLTHATMLANLSKMNNPMATLSSILMSRFVSGFGYSNITQRTTIKQKIPHQTQVKVGILKVSNDHTHLEGIWNVDEAHINTKKFTTSAPKYDVKQNSQSSGFCVSFSPAAVVSATIMPGIGSTLSCLPSVGTSESDGHAERTVNSPMRFNANKLFIQCDNAVFSASQIRAKFIEMVVSGDLTIESLRDTFMSESNSSEVSGSLAAVFSSVHGTTGYRSALDPKLGIIPHLRVAEEEEITKKVNSLAELIGTEKFYLKVGGLLYKRGADAGLRPDGLVVKSDAEKIEAERILSENIPAEHSRKRKVINPSLGELVAAMGQIDEFRSIRAQFITQRLAEGASMKQAEAESKEITEKNVQKAKELRTERAKRKAKVLDKIKSKLPKSSNPEIRARLIQAYLNEHGTEIIAESEQYTLGEIKAEVDLIGSVKGEKAKSFLANYAEAEMVSEDFERNAEDGVRQVYSGIAEAFNRTMIPGYSAWADGGTSVEVISSAGSDIVLTLIGGKVIKVAWTGTKALYSGAKALGKVLIPGKTQIIRCTPRQSELYVGKMLGTKVKPQVSYLDGKEVPYGTKGSVRPDFVMGDKAAFEVKNYDIAKNSDGLVREVVRQVKDRAIHLPQGMKQRLMIDVRGQNVSDVTKEALAQKIIQKCDGVISMKDITFF